MYDLIINDATDPFGASEGLLQENSTVTVIRRLRRTEYLCTSMEVLL